MVHINELPNNILELIFDWLDFRSRCNVRLVCRKWDNVSFSESFIDRKVVLVVRRHHRILDLTMLSHRKHTNLSIRMDGPPQFGNEFLTKLRILPSVVPSPKSIRLFVGIAYDLKQVKQLFNLSTVETFYLSGHITPFTNRTAWSTNVSLQMDRLLTLNLDVFGIGKVRFSMPNLRHLNMVVHSQEDVDLLSVFTNQLHSLTVWLRMPCNLNNLEMKNLRKCSINLPKDMTETERNVLPVFKHCVQLECLELSAKSIRRCILDFIAGNLPQLVELTIQASDDSIDLEPITKLPWLKRLRIVAYHVSLRGVQQSSLLSLELCAENAQKGIAIEPVDCFKGFTRLNKLSLKNVILNYGFRKSMWQHEVLNEIIMQLPEMRLLRLDQCLELRQWEIDILKEMHPQLVIAFQENHEQLLPAFGLLL